MSDGRGEFVFPKFFNILLFKNAIFNEFAALRYESLADAWVGFHYTAILKLDKHTNDGRHSKRNLSNKNKSQ